MSVASAQFIQKNTQQQRESHGSDFNNRSEAPTAGSQKVTHSSSQANNKNPNTAGSI